MFFRGKKGQREISFRLSIHCEEGGGDTVAAWLQWPASTQLQLGVLMHTWEENGAIQAKDVYVKMVRQRALGLSPLHSQTIGD